MRTVQASCIRILIATVTGTNKIVDITQRR
jgi:hypothetical protein